MGVYNDEAGEGADGGAVECGVEGGGVDGQKDLGVVMGTTESLRWF